MININILSINIEDFTVTEKRTMVTPRLPRKRASKFEKSGLKEIFFDHFATATPDISTREVRLMVASDRRVLASKGRRELLARMGDSTPNIYRNEWLSKSADEQMRSGFYKWPESHIGGLRELPFEAAPLCLAVAHVMESHGYRATIQQIRWAHRLYLSAPEFPLDTSLPLHSRSLRSIDEETDDLIVWDLTSLSNILATFENARLVNPDCLVYGNDVLEQQQATIFEVVADFLHWEPWKSPEQTARYITNSTVARRGPHLIRWQEKMVHVVAPPGQYFKRPTGIILWAHQEGIKGVSNGTPYELAQIGHPIGQVTTFQDDREITRKKDNVVNQKEPNNNPQSEDNENADFYSETIRNKDQVEQSLISDRDTQAELRKLMDEGALG
jgi:hypothetical protein